MYLNYSIAYEINLGSLPSKLWINGGKEFSKEIMMELYEIELDLKNDILKQYLYT